jgi:RNA polymerase sigma-70 factor (ECF subfamily)
VNASAPIAGRTALPVQSGKPARRYRAETVSGGRSRNGHPSSRFTTWACKFVILEVSAKIGRHFWRNPGVRLEAEDWDQLPGRFGFDPAAEAEWRDLLAALRRAVDEELTARQRRVFVAIVLNDVPLDTLVIELDSNRNAIYKTMFDARRKLRAALVANGYLRDDPDPSRRP